jgi:hypothetical protein
MSSAETQLLADLAPLDGSSARAVKRYVNLYRLARAQNANHLGALAFVPALDAGGTQSEIAVLNDALSNAEGDADLAFHQCQRGARLIEALAAVRLAQGNYRHYTATAIHAIRPTCSRTASLSRFRVWRNGYDAPHAIADVVGRQ